MNDQERREQRIAQTMRYCQHYDPNNMIGLRIGTKATGLCKAGVNAREHFGGAAIQWCCTKGNDATHEQQIAACPKWLRKTREEAEARANAIDNFMNKMKLVGPAVAEWRNKPPRGKAEVIECPACKGRLHLSQASSNGHVWGKCETADCVSWME